MGLPTIFDVCEPRDDVLKGSIQEADFAADLAQVLSGDVLDKTKNPSLFFANTHPTIGLKNLLHNLCLRLSGSGKEVSSIFRLHTQYGGGKTHALIALAHAAQGMQGVKNTSEFVEKKILPKGKVRVAAFDGENADPASGRALEKGIRAYTPWGEIAYQLGGAAGFEKLRANDERGIAPGAENLRDLFDGEPALILLDELAVYLRAVQTLPVADQLVRFLTNLFKAVEGTSNAAVVSPDDRLPARLGDQPPTQPASAAPEPPEETAAVDLRRLVWSFIQQAPGAPDGGERIGEATSAVTPWPHQIKVFDRLYDNWPPKLLIADEVGLGKTIEAGMLLRQAWLAGKAKRILILAPKAILNQWQIELREKFNLNWPIYDGQRLSWYFSPALAGQEIRKVGRQDWHKEPVVITSSQLMRRSDRAMELLEEAEPWDLVVLDEAHHARRRGAGLPGERGPNQLLRLMQGLRERVQGLILLTATPMQVDPIEVWDLLNLLVLPSEWTPEAYRQFFDLAAHPNPSHADFERMATLFRATVQHFGQVEPGQVIRFISGGSQFKADKLIKALCDPAVTPRRQLEKEEREAALRIMCANTPVARLVSRHTRELLRRYYKAGKITLRIAEREVEDVFIDLTDEERALYEAVEDYISTTYNQAEPDRRNAVGFVMTIYRRRLASSFYALAQTLEDRLKRVTSSDQEDIFDDETADDVMDADEAADTKREALVAEENSEIEELLRGIRRLPTDTKAGILKSVLRKLKQDGYSQVMIFTQYTDTMDFLRKELADEFGTKMMCFSGRGGEIMTPDGSWDVVSRDNVKKRFREGEAEYLVCTEAAAEGLNFQFCGALVNYDMPWNPMKVEQRIGRIDRLGQEYEHIRIVNLHYQNTVEADVYIALRQRINLFTTFVGKLQPILAKLPSRIAEASMASGDRELARQNVVAEIEADADAAEATGFDLDEIAASEFEEPERPSALIDMEDLDRILGRTELLPPDLDVKPMHGSKRQYSFSRPGMREPIRVTTDPAIFDEHPESVELWSPGSPIFPEPDYNQNPDDVTAQSSTLSEIFRNL